jgi:hypothetical protein
MRVPFWIALATAAAVLAAASPSLGSGPPWIVLDDDENPWALPKPPRDKSDWRFDVMPFAWIAGSEGVQRTDGDVSGEETVVERDTDLEFAAMFRAEAGAGDVSIRLSGVYLDLSADAAGSAGTRVDATLTSLIGELALGYRVAGDPWHKFDWAKRGKARPGFVDALVGARVMDVDLDLDFDTRPDSSDGATWVDPFVGLRGRVFAFSWLTLGAEGTIGGFGVGSDLAWSAEAVAQVVLSKTLYVAVGYSFLDLDYEEGGDGLTIDARIRGPWLGVGFVF